MINCYVIWWAWYLFICHPANQLVWQYLAGPMTQCWQVKCWLFISSRLSNWDCLYFIKFIARMSTSAETMFALSHWSIKKGLVFATHSGGPLPPCEGERSSGDKQPHWKKWTRESSESDEEDHPPQKKSKTIETIWWQHAWACCLWSGWSLWQWRGLH